MVRVRNRVTRFLRLVVARSECPTGKSMGNVRIPFIKPHKKKTNGTEKKNINRISFALQTRSSATTETARILHCSVVRCKRHFDMLNRLQACASIIVNVEIICLNSKWIWRCRPLNKSINNDKITSVHCQRHFGKLKCSWLR